jgi:hypothetical protein
LYLKVLAGPNRCSNKDSFRISMLKMSWTTEDRRF